MSDEPTADDQNTVTRRRMLKRIGAGAAVAWTTPILTTMRTPAFAASPGPCREDCYDIPYFRLSDLSCDDECHHCNDCFGCGSCGCGQSCPTITSVEMQPDGSVRFCTSCLRIAPSGGGNGGWVCKSGGCASVFIEVDPNDQNCAVIPVPEFPCPDGADFACAHFVCRCTP